MKCIIVDDEPLGRKAVERLIEEIATLNLLNIFSDAFSAGEFLHNN